MHTKRTLLDKDAPPDALRQVVPGDELALRLNQFRKNFKGTPAQGNEFSGRAQFASSKIDFPFRANVDVKLAWVSHNWDSQNGFAIFRPAYHQPCRKTQVAGRHSRRPLSRNARCSAAAADRSFQHLLKPGVFLVDGLVRSKQWTLRRVTTAA